MASYYSDDEETKQAFPDNNDDIDDDQMPEDIDEDDIFASNVGRDDDVEMVQVRTYAGDAASMDKVHWSVESGFGLSSTTAEGTFGKLMQKRARQDRTPEEIFRDDVLVLCRTQNFERGICNTILKLIPRIPQIKYRNAAAFVFAYHSIPLESNRKEMEKLVEKAKKEKVDHFSIVRYARLIKMNKLI